MSNDFYKPLQITFGKVIFIKIGIVPVVSISTPRVSLRVTVKNNLSSLKNRIVKIIIARMETGLNAG